MCSDVGARRDSGCARQVMVAAMMVIFTLALFPAHAATITVTHAGDSNAQDGASCTLRQAVLSANRNGIWGSCTAGEAEPVIDRIEFSPTLNGVPIVLALELNDGPIDGIAGPLFVDEPLHIIGNGGIRPNIDNPVASTANTLISGNGLTQIFQMGVSTGEVLIEQLGLTGGEADPNGNSDLQSGAAIRANCGTELTLRHAVIFGNRAGRGGGGITMCGELVVENTAIIGNRVAGDTSSTTRSGGGIELGSGSLLVRQSIVSGNVVESPANRAEGGAIYVGGAFTMSDSIVTGNIVRSIVGEDRDVAEGGGLMIETNDSSIIERSLIANNRAEAVNEGSAFSGGIQVGRVTGSVANVTAELRNVTIFGNRVIAQHGEANGGGARLNRGNSRLNNVTVTANHAERTGDATNVTGGGVWVGPDASVRAANSLIAGNTDRGAAPDCFGSIASDRHNLIGIDQGCTLTNSGSEDQVGTVTEPVNPLLDGLGENGGGITVGEIFIPMQTAALLGGSSAIDAGDPNLPGVGGTCEIVDQRGQSRPADGDDDGGARCDIGAFELSGSAPVDPLSPSITSLTLSGPSPSNVGDVASLSWSSVNTSRCVFSGDADGETVPSFSNFSVAFDEARTWSFTLECFNAENVSTGPQTLIRVVVAAPEPTPPGFEQSSGGGTSGWAWFLVMVPAALLRRRKLT